MRLNDVEVTIQVLERDGTEYSVEEHSTELKNSGDSVSCHIVSEARKVHMPQAQYPTPSLHALDIPFE